MIRFQRQVVHVGATRASDLATLWRTMKYRFMRWMQQRFLSGPDSAPRLPLFESFAQHGVSNFQLELIREYEVCDAAHMHARHQVWINKIEQSSEFAEMINEKDVLLLPPPYMRQRQYDQSYYQKKIKDVRQKQRNRTPVICECGRKLMQCNLRIHRGSQIHINICATRSDPARSCISGGSG